jgi:hypothetical protein
MLIIPSFVRLSLLLKVIVLSTNADYHMFVQKQNGQTMG